MTGITSESKVYTSLHVPTQTWKSISMDFVDVFPTTRKGHNCLFMVADRASKMCILMLCLKEHKSMSNNKRVLWTNDWVHFRIPRGIILDKDIKFLSFFWITLQERRTYNITSIYRWKEEVVNRNLVHILRGYNQKHLMT